jgi:hypothetical protein
VTDRVIAAVLLGLLTLVFWAAAMTFGMES